jgi:hypothetical protein
MTDPHKARSTPPRTAADRLGAALRENLKRRKAQAKGRADQAGDTVAGDARPAPNSAGIRADKPSGNT